MFTWIKAEMRGAEIPDFRRKMVFYVITITCVYVPVDYEIS